MRKNTIKVWALLAMSLATATTFTACSDDDDTTPAPHPEYNWSEDGGLKACDNLLFEGNQIGNGDNEFVFKGKQTLKKGTYLLKGWVYIADGAEIDHRTRYYY